MQRRLRVLLVEDSEDDAGLIALELRRGGFDPSCRRVETAEGMRTALETEQFDVVICDYLLPGFAALPAIAIAEEGGRDIPFIVVSGTVREETAVEALKAGAHDFVVKDRMARLVPAINRELREAEVRRERRQALADLKLAVQVRDDFLAIASHELRTPLTALDLQVRTALDLAGAVTGDGMATKLTAKLAMGMRQVDRLKTLIDNLLDVTRLTSGSVRLVPRETDLTQILKDVVARIRQARIEQTEIDVQTDGPALGCWDPVLIEAVVSNLLSNALKFGAGKPVQVRASTDGDLATLVVRDHGIGIDPKDQQRIFERFEKAVSERHYGGFGLGLWVARKAVEAHHGSIRVSSVPGAGSTFVVELSRGRAGG